MTDSSERSILPTSKTSGDLPLSLRTWCDPAVGARLSNRAADELERLARQRDDYCRQLTQGIPVVRDLTLERDRLRAALRELLALADISTPAPDMLPGVVQRAREVLNGEQPPSETSERCMHGHVVCEKCATMAVNKHLAEIGEIHDRHARVSKLLWGPGAVPGTMLGPMDSDAAHADRGRLLSLLPHSPSKASGES